MSGQKSRLELLRENEELRALLKNSQNFEDPQNESVRILHALYQIADLAGSATDIDHFYVAIHQIVGQLMYAENFYIALFDRDSGRVSFPYFVDTHETEAPNSIPIEKIKRGLTAYVLRSGASLLATPEAIAAMIADGDIEQVGAYCVEWLGAPLINDGEICGVIVVQSYDEGVRYKEEDETLLTFVAQHISRALERQIHREDLERRVEARTGELRQAMMELEQEVIVRKRGERLKSVLFEISELAHSTVEMTDFFRSVHHIIGELLNAENFYIAIVNQEQETLYFPYRVDYFDQDSPPRKLSGGLTEYVLSVGKPTLLSRQQQLAMAEQGALKLRGTLSFSWLGVPLKDQGQVFGVLAIQTYSEQESYTEADLELVNFVSQHIAGAIARKRSAEALKKAHDELEERVKERTAELYEANLYLEEQMAERRSIEERLIHDALHDALTGLPNRSLFMDRLEQAMKRGVREKRVSFAVLFVDLDRFKIVNDSLGHMLGDELLKDVSNRITGCLRSCDTVARLGGDEFAILLENLSSIDEVHQIVSRIFAKLDVPFDLENHQVFTTASIGIALANKRYSRAEELLRDADAAMYRAKSKGRHCAEVFDQSMHLYTVSILELESDLRRAVEKNEFEVFYQPIVKLSTGRIVGFEALIRWQHPKRGRVMPKDFISLAEETGLVVPMDWCVFQLAAEQLSHWLHQFPEFRPLIVSINFSSKHFSSPNFSGQVRDLLDHYKLPASSLKVEITERALLDNLQTVREVLHELKKMKIQLLLDDFGTGYSSLSYLHRFPMDTLKIDKSFVGEMLESQESMAIVRTIKTLASSLEMGVVAEGIENKRQYLSLNDLQCEFGQGFYISRPLDVAQSTALLASEHRFDWETGKFV